MALPIAKSAIVSAITLPLCHVTVCCDTLFAGRLGLGNLDSYNSPQQVSVPADFEAQNVLCGVDCSMIISTQQQILACGSNR